MSYRISWSIGVADKIPPGETVEFDVYGQTPRFGRWWWFWLPMVNHNDGKFSRREVVDWTLCWLCFAVNVTFWPAGDAP